MYSWYNLKCYIVLHYTFNIYKFYEGDIYIEGKSVIDRTKNPSVIFSEWVSLGLHFSWLIIVDVTLVLDHLN